MKILNLNNFKYQTAGLSDRDTLFIFHGLGDSISSFNEYVSILISKFRLVFFDLPGHGNNKSLTLSIEDTVKTLNELVRQEKSYNNYSISHSFGGLLNLLINQTHRFEKIISVEPSISEADVNFFKFIQEPPAGIGYKEFLDIIVEDRPYATIYKNNVIDSNKESFIRYVSEYNRNCHDLIENSLESCANLVYVFGSESTDIELRYKLIKSNNIKSYQIENAQHWVHKDNKVKFTEVLNNELIHT